MARGETTDEFATRIGESWAYHGGLPGDPGWVSDAARICGDKFGIDAQALDSLAEDDGWEHHDPGYGDKVRYLAEHWIEVTSP